MVPEKATRGVQLLRIDTDAIESPYRTMSVALSEAPPRRVRWVWILDRRKDLAFYIGSAVAGWLYVALVWYGISHLGDPLKDSLGTLRFGGLEVAFTLELLVVASWAVLLDAPHVWGTLGRTLADPDEWRNRRRELLMSFVWFGVGPVAILTPYLVGSVTSRFGYVIPADGLAMGALGFFVVFRLWAYYHVVRQHWGFFNLYKRRADDYSHHRLDSWFFNLTLYMPLVLFLTASYYNQAPGFPDLGLHTPVVAGLTLAQIIHPVAWAAYLGVLLLYAAGQVELWRRGEPLNGSKLLYMALLIPLHFVAFSHPIMAAFLVPVVTVGHNIQYHCIVYSYAGRKYKSNDDRRYRLPRLLFKNLAVYGLVGLAFTFLVYRGPWIEWIKSSFGLDLDNVLFNSLGMMAGVKDPSSLGLGEKVLAAVIIGFAMQHYYLDSKIWRVSKDKDVQKNLQV